MKKKNNTNNHVNKGFTLLEIIVVITIIGILTAMVSGNFISSIKKSRDARRKVDIEQIQKAIEMYYEDNRTFPLTEALTFGGQLCHPTGGCTTKLYMQKIPNDPLSSQNYSYTYESADGTNYKLYSCIENTQDTGSGVKQAGYTGKTCGTSTSCTVCKYGISSGNVTP